MVKTYQVKFMHFLPGARAKKNSFEDFCFAEQTDELEGKGMGRKGFYCGGYPQNSPSG